MAFASIGLALGASAAAATAVGAAATVAGGTALASGASAIGSNQRRKRRERELDEYAKQSPLYGGSKPISEYYQQALNRYNENAYQSQQYQLGAMNARRATAQGLGALQDRRSAIGGISRLEAGQNAAMQNLGAQAEAQRNARFGQLGSATQMKNADLMQQFDINKMTPYNRQFGLKQLKSQAANQQYAQDVENTMGAINNLASVGMLAGQSQAPISNVSSGVDMTPAATWGTNYIPFNSYQQNTPFNQGSAAYNDYANRLRNKISTSKKNSLGTNYNF
jgi:hypothetical protein